MATLYTQADSNIRKTWLYLTVFFILIISLGWLFSYLYNSQAILIFAVFLSIIMSFGSYWYSDKIVLAMSGANPIEKKDNAELYRLVENISITAGMPLPKIYIIEESQPNAFATGRDEKHAVIAVTRGLLSKLDRTELEGVIAHEISHIKGKDMLLGTIIVVFVGIITILADWFFRISFWGGGRRGRDSERGGGIIMLLGILAAVLAPIAATLIQLAISRKREFLADAEGALLTRYPEGLAKALEKIASDPNPLRVANNSTAHLYITSPFRGRNTANWLTKLFLTHPPVEERIAALTGMKI